MQTLSLFIYNISIRLLGLAILLASFFNKKAKQWIEGRQNWRNQLRGLKQGDGKRIWLHCASLGEFEQARPVIEKLRTERKDDLIVVSFFSPSGYEIRKNYAGADLVIYLPLATAGNAKEFRTLLRPDLVLFVKYEFWFHYLNELKQQNIPVILFSAVFRSNQVFFQWYGGLFRHILSCYRKIFVQNSESQKLLQTIGVASEVANDTRFDRVYQIAKDRRSFLAIEKFKTGSKVLIAGSTWPKDEELLIQCINEDILKEYKYILAPHNLNDERIAQTINSIKARARRFSVLTEQNAAETDVVIIDNIGNLASLYAYGEMAYVGGGFNASVHNVLEAAVYQIPVLFGPNFQKSEEAKELLQLSLAFDITDHISLKEKLLHIDATIAGKAATKKKIGDYIEAHLGGTDEIVKAAKGLLK